MYNWTISQRIFYVNGTNKRYTLFTLYNPFDSKVEAIIRSASETETLLLKKMIGDYSFNQSIANGGIHEPFRKAINRFSKG